MTIDLEVLGMTQEELQARVVERISSKALNEYAEEDDEGSPRWSLEAAVRSHVAKMVSEAVERLGEAHVIPNVIARLEKMTLEATNAWGERRGERVTFTEYMVQRAESYLNEKVTSDGRVPDTYHRADQTRIAWLLDQHFSEAIHSALADTAKLMREEMAQGIGEAVKIKLEEMLTRLKVTATS